jgi:hypothetical protein
MSKFNYGDIITNFRDKSKEDSQSTLEWIENELRTWKVIDVKDNCYDLQKLDNLTKEPILDSNGKKIEFFKEKKETNRDYKLWDYDFVNAVYERAIVAIEKEKIEDEERAKATDETIKKYFDDGYEYWKGGPKIRSINKTAEYFKRELKYVWDLIEKMSEMESSENDNNYGLEDAKDYSDVREELFGPEDWEIREYFDKNKSIRKLASQYFDEDLEKAWEFIEDYDGRSDGLEGARDYDIVYEALFPDDSDDDDENN